MRLTMASELGFQDKKPLSSSSGVIGRRDTSPDSLIFTPESNFSLLSSASASGDRCSFASDSHDHASLVSEFSLDLAGNNLSESSGAPDSDSKKRTVPNSGRLARSAEKKPNGVKKEDCQRELQDGVRPVESAGCSFSLALKEYHEQKSRSDAVFNERESRRPVTLDLNNFATSSPKLGSRAMKKTSALSRRSTTFTSPGTPNFRHNSVGIQKGWSSERVPGHPHVNRRHTAALLPFHNGRTLPSKWEDAERWIFSPVSLDGGLRPGLPQAQRRPKSKSGPLGPPGVACQPFYSPVMPVLDGSNCGNSVASSPFSAGVLVADGLAAPFGCNGRAFPLYPEPCMGRSASVHGCTEMPGQLFSGFRDERVDHVKDAATCISHAASRRDMATQMSPDVSTNSSPERRLSFTLPTPSVLPDPESAHSARLEVRDVQVDEHVTVTRWSKKHRGRISRKKSGNVKDSKQGVMDVQSLVRDRIPRKSGNVKDSKKSAVDSQSSVCDDSETGDSISKVKREEAKILAWENLQKAKAEAAIRKLEMELEKKRSSSMDKILSKLSSAQKRAQEMRSSVSTDQTHQVARASHKAPSFRRTCHMGSLSGCFTCHAF